VEIISSDRDYACWGSKGATTWRATSYPGKVAGKAVTFLLDSGCNTNFLSKRVFDALPPKVRKELAPYTGEPGNLADGSRIPFYGVIELPGRVRDQAI